MDFRDEQDVSTERGKRKRQYIITTSACDIRMRLWCHGAQKSGSCSRRSAGGVLGLDILGMLLSYGLQCPRTCTE